MAAFCFLAPTVANLRQHSPSTSAQGIHGISGQGWGPWLIEDYKTAPPFPMEVFDTIMEKVGFMDLMRCKLMCHSWWKGIDGMRPSAKAAIRRKVEALQI